MISKHATLDDVDVLLVPDSHDQLFMKSMEPRLHAYLAAGGHFFINGHLVHAVAALSLALQGGAAQTVLQLDDQAGESRSLFWTHGF